MADISAFVVNLVINIIIGIVVMLLFIVLRRMPANQWLYNTRASDEHRQAYLKPPPTYPTFSWLSWLTTTWRTSETEMLESCGLDNVMYYLYHYTLLKFFGFFTLLCLIILIPVNATSGDNVSDGFALISMANITTDETTRLTAHLICAYIFFITAIVMMTQLYDKFLRLRQIHIKSMQTLYCTNLAATNSADVDPLLHDSEANDQPPPEHEYSNMSILIRDLPKQYQTPLSFKQYFTYLFGDANVQSTYLPKNVHYLRQLVKKRDDLMNKLEHVNIVHERKCAKATRHNKPLPKPATKRIWSTCASVDLVQWLHGEIDRLNILIRDETRRVQSDETPYLNSGIVTLNKSVLHALVTENVNVTHNTLVSTLSHCPEPDDLLYDQLNISHVSRIVRGYAMFAATVALVLFWSIPITAISALTTLSNIGGSVPFVMTIVNVSPILSGFLSGFLPSLAFIIFQALLPLILTQFTKLEGKDSKSALDLGLYSKFYLFQFINFFIITVLAGAVLNQITSLINNPTSIVTLFGQSIPIVATQFLNYVIIQTFVSWPMSLLSGVGLIVGTLKHKYLAVTAKEHDAAHSGITMGYGTNWPQDLLIYIIGVSYAIISPVVLPFVFVYHIFACVVIKYQCLYMFDTPEFETGGMYWPLAFNRMIASLIVAQITLLGLFGLKEAPIHAGFTVVLIPATIIYCIQINSRWRPYSYSLSLDEAASVDVLRAKAIHQHTDESAYRQAELDPEQLSDNLDLDKRQARALFDVHNTILFATKSVKSVSKSVGKAGRAVHSTSKQIVHRLTSPKQWSGDDGGRATSEPMRPTSTENVVLNIHN